jgi:hypothetical protein
LDIRFNPGLGPAAHASLAEAFSNGAALALVSLNGIALDAGGTSLSLEGRGSVHRYELLWVARRLASVDRRGRVRELNLKGCGIGVDAAVVVAAMLPSLARTVGCLDLSYNNLCGIHRDRYASWHGAEDCAGFEAILASLQGRTVQELKLNGCALGTSGAAALAAVLQGPGKGEPGLRVLSLEVRSGYMEVQGLAALLGAVGVDPVAPLDSGLGLGTAAWSTEGASSVDQPSVDLIEPPYCPIVCLDTRGNVVDQLAEVSASAFGCSDCLCSPPRLCLSRVGGPR